MTVNDAHYMAENAVTETWHCKEMQADQDVVSFQCLCTDTFRAACDALVALVQARSCHLYFVDGAGPLASGMASSGLPVASADGLIFPELAFPIPQRLPLRDHSPTDSCDLVLSLAGSEDNVMAWVELRNVPQGWDSRDNLGAIAQLSHILHVQIRALQQPTPFIAPLMLALIDRLHELDDRAASHLLMGVLHLLVGRIPSQVEATALCIAGLSDMPVSMPPRPEVKLNSDGFRVLYDAGFGAGLNKHSDLAQASEEKASRGAENSGAKSHSALPPLGLRPFAKIHLLKQDTEIAQDDPSETLWFRTAGQDVTWRLLECRTADGWTAIAAEVVEKTIDVVRAFAEMHLIRRRDIPTDIVAEIYDLHGLVWWVRDSAAGTEARLDGADWTVFPSRNALTGKARAVEALMLLVPDLGQKFDSQARDWAGRMARSVQVIPVIG